MPKYKINYILLLDYKLKARKLNINNKTFLVVDMCNRKVGFM